MIRKALRQLQGDAEAAKSLFEALWGGDGGERAGLKSLEAFQRKLFSGGEVLKFHWTMAALDDRSRAIVCSDAPVEFGEVASIAFGDENMGGASQVCGGFAQGAAREQIFVAEGGLAVDQDKIKAPVKSQILETIVKDEKVAPDLRDGMAPAGDTVLVDNNRDPAKILCQHEGLVPRILGIQEEGSALGNNANWRWVGAGDRTPGAFVSTAEDRNFPSLQGEFPGQSFDHGCLAGSSHGQVADAHHRASDLVSVEEIRGEKPESQGDDCQVQVR